MAQKPTEMRAHSTPKNSLIPNTSSHHYMVLTLAARFFMKLLEVWSIKVIGLRAKNRLTFSLRLPESSAKAENISVVP